MRTLISTVVLTTLIACASSDGAGVGGHTSDQRDTVPIPSSCIGLSDGHYYLKLLEGDAYPVVYAKCSNEFMILDPSLDSDIAQYFDSFDKFHVSVAGPDNSHQVNWQDWFLPSSLSSEVTTDDDAVDTVDTAATQRFVISPDCNTCAVSNQRQLYADRTVYMMTGSLFGCFWERANEHQLDEDFSSYQCYFQPDADTDSDADLSPHSAQGEAVGDRTVQPLTDDSTIADWDRSGTCAFNVRAADLPVTPELGHDGCTADLQGAHHGIDYGYHLKPSLGTDGSFCVCHQSTSDATTHALSDDLARKQQIITEMREAKNGEVQLDEEDAAEQSEIIYYLYASDFATGTYRITRPGRYVLMEDVAFNPNAGTTRGGEANDDMWAWRPREAQGDTYPGAGELSGAYFLGFWAAIAIEASDVTLDLNDHTLAMHETFYLQQRWFTLISLNSQYFLPGQGNGFFGAEPAMASNVIIKDGTLGLTSHHCIHGNLNRNILIEHIVCRDFETHGIQLNGFENVKIRNVEIGPSSQRAFLRAEYGLVRALLPRLEQVADENPDTLISFDGRDDDDGVTMSFLFEELLRRSNMIFDYVANGEEPEISTLKERKDWLLTRSLFYNPSGLPDGASLYGVFANTAGASTMGFNLNVREELFSSALELENLEIHDLRHRMNEYLRVAVRTSGGDDAFGSVLTNPLGAPLEAQQMLASLDESDLIAATRYKGSALTDALFAMSALSDDFGVLGQQRVFAADTVPWATGDDITKLDRKLQLGCNNDAMLQSGKGVMGVRVDGVRGAKLANLDIYNLVAETAPGSSACGEYTSFEPNSGALGGGHMAQRQPMQVGFSGNNVQGVALNAADEVEVTDVNVHNLVSLSGDAIGVAVWPSVNLDVTGDVSVEDIVAGAQLTSFALLEEALSWDSRPNRAPMACAVLSVGKFYSKETETTYVSSIEIAGDDESENEHAKKASAKIWASHISGAVGCNGGEAQTMLGEYMDDSNADEAVDDEADTLSDPMQGIAKEADDWTTTDHVLLGTVIAVSILCCGFVVMGYVAYLYCRHKRKQKETEQRAKILLQQAQQENDGNFVRERNRGFDNPWTHLMMARNGSGGSNSRDSVVEEAEEESSRGGGMIEEEEEVQLAIDEKTPLMGHASGHGNRNSI